MRRKNDVIAMKVLHLLIMQVKVKQCMDYTLDDKLIPYFKRFKRLIPLCVCVEGIPGYKISP